MRCRLRLPARCWRRASPVRERAGRRPRQIFWIVVAMVGARSAAMTVNRIADVQYDRVNPRTSSRALATGALSMGFAWAFTRPARRCWCSPPGS